MIAFTYFDKEMVETEDSEGSETTSESSVGSSGASEPSGATTGRSSSEVSGAILATFLVGIKTIGTNFRDFGAEFWISDELLSSPGNFRECSCIAAICASNSSRYGRSC